MMFQWDFKENNEEEEERQCSTLRSGSLWGSFIYYSTRARLKCARGLVYAAGCGSLKNLQCLAVNLPTASRDMVTEYVVCRGPTMVA